MIRDLKLLLYLASSIFRVLLKLTSLFVVKFVFTLQLALPNSPFNSFLAKDASRWRIYPNDKTIAAVASVLTKSYFSALSTIDPTELTLRFAWLPTLFCFLSSLIVSGGDVWP